MTTEPYTPDRGTVRYRYVDGDYSGGNRDPHAEFDRFIAKIKADALREATTGAVVVSGVLGYKEEFVSVRGLLDRADRIEEEA